MSGEDDWLGGKSDAPSVGMKLIGYLVVCAGFMGPQLDQSYGFAVVPGLHDPEPEGSGAAQTGATAWNSLRPGHGAPKKPPDLSDADQATKEQQIAGHKRAQDKSGGFKVSRDFHTDEDNRDSACATDRTVATFPELGGTVESVAGYFRSGQPHGGGG